MTFCFPVILGYLGRSSVISINSIHREGNDTSNRDYDLSNRFSIPNRTDDYPNDPSPNFSDNFSALSRKYLIPSFFFLSLSIAKSSIFEISMPDILDPCRAKFLTASPLPSIIWDKME